MNIHNTVQTDKWSGRCVYMHIHMHIHIHTYTHT